MISDSTFRFDIRPCRPGLWRSSADAWANSARGFTSVELLVVVGIIALLAGLAIPAIQSIREQARLAECQNNIRNLSFGMANYESAQRRLPCGTLGFADSFQFDLLGNWANPDSEYFWKRSQHSSFALQILPYIEEQARFKQINPALINQHKLLDETSGYQTGSYSWFGDVTGFVEIATNEIQGFLCPSDDMSDSSIDRSLIVLGGSQPVNVAEYGSDGFAWIGLTNGGIDELPPAVYGEAMREEFALTNYLGCSGAHSGVSAGNVEMSPYSGMMRSRIPLRLNEVRDGLSNTVLLGESTGGLENGQRIISQSWAIGGLARIRGNIPWMHAIHPNQWHWRQLGNSDDSSAFGFGSKHHSIVNFAFGDGSVRAISRETNWLVLYEIGGIADGSVVEPLNSF